MLLLSASLLAILPSLCCATSLVIHIPQSPHLPNPNTLSPATHATLLSSSPNIPSYTAPLTTQSTLEFRNLTIPESSLGSQSLLLTISAPSHVFASYRVDLIPNGFRGKDGMGAAIEGVWPTYLGSPWADKGPILGGKAAQDGGASGAVGGLANSGASEHQSEQMVSIYATAISKRDFYQQRPGFNPLAMLMNPMILLGVLAMGVTFGMPYLMENIDPDLRAEFEEQKNKGPLAGMHKALQDAASGSGGGGDSSADNAGGGSGNVGNFDLASWMAGTRKDKQSISSGAEVREGGKRRR